MFNLASSSKKVYIVGSGGLAKEVYNLLMEHRVFSQESSKTIKFDFKGYLDEDYNKCSESKNIYHLSSTKLSQINGIVYIAIGDPKTKQRLRRALCTGHFLYLNCSWNKSNKKDQLKIGVGSIIFPNVIFTANNKVGEFTTIYPNCTICHDTTIGDYCNITPGVNIAGRCKIGNRVYLGIGSSISNDVNICDDVIIGAGAVVVDSIKEPGTYVGVPARKIK